MKSIVIQASKVKGKDVYTLSALSGDVIEHAIFVQVTPDDISDLLEMMEELDK